MVVWATLLHSFEQHLGPQLAGNGQPPETHSADPHYGMNPAVYALVFGIVSGTSLPIGAWLGIMLSPVNDKTVSLTMAFGAGALLFAVTVELYGHALREVAKGRLGLLEMFTTIFGALAGAALYLTINKWLDDYMNEVTESEEKDVEGQDAKGPQSSSVVEALRKGTEAAAASNKDEEEPKSARAKELWQKAKLKAKVVKTLKRTTTLMKSEDLQHLRGHTKAVVMAAEEGMLSAEDAAHAKSVALALFLGLLVDGLPEGVLMGFLAAEGHLTPVLIVSLFVANFPEAFSSASLLIQAEMSKVTIIGMWTGLCIVVGCLSGASCYLLLLFFPTFGEGGGHSDLPMTVLLGISLVEGLTGGAMISCISSVMLPEAFYRNKEIDGKKNDGPFYAQTGFLCTAGFLLSVALKAVFG